jgi:hypothetical protein
LCIVSRNKHVCVQTRSRDSPYKIFVLRSGIKISTTPVVSSVMEARPPRLPHRRTPGTQLSGHSRCLFRSRRCARVAASSSHDRRAGVRGEAVVRGLRGGGGGGVVSSEAEKEMLGLRPKGTKLRSAVGGEEALVRWLREGARGGRELAVHRCPLRNTF